MFACFKKDNRQLYFIHCIWPTPTSTQFPHTPHTLVHPLTHSQSSYTYTVTALPIFSIFLSTTFTICNPNDDANDSDSPAWPFRLMSPTRPDLVTPCLQDLVIQFDSLYGDCTSENSKLKGN